jgi:hypothetical protein
MPIAGVVYQQHRKRIAQPPDFLKTHGRFSVNKSMTTTYALYAKALLGLYGKLEKAPGTNIEFLNHLATQESQNQDDLVRRDFPARNEYQIRAEEGKILLEAAEMLNPDIPIYPNPTRDCQWQCPFQMACINLDDGGDWEHELEQVMVDREEERDTWRNYLRIPQQAGNQDQQLVEAGLLPESLLSVVPTLQPQLYRAQLPTRR